MRATAITRSSHHDSTPSLADPSPRARPSGERMRRCLSIILSGQNRTTDPGGYGKHGARRHDNPPGGVDGAELKAATGVPQQMPDASAKVQEEAKDAADEQNLSEQGLHEVLHDGIGLRSGGGRSQPRDQRDGVNAQRDTGQPMGEGQDGGELWPVDLKVRREGSR